MTLGNCIIIQCVGVLCGLDSSVDEVICPSLILVVILLIQGLGGVKAQHVGPVVTKGTVILLINSILVLLNGVNIEIGKICNRQLMLTNLDSLAGAQDDAVNQGSDDHADHDCDNQHHDKCKGQGICFQFLSLSLFLLLLSSHCSGFLLLTEFLFVGCAHVINSSRFVNAREDSRIDSGIITDLLASCKCFLYLLEKKKKVYNIYI